MAAMLAAPRKGTGRLDVGGALAGWLRTNTGAHVHQSSGAAATAAEASRLRDFAQEPLGTVEEVQQKLLRYYHLLTALEMAVPIGPERRGVSVVFGWTDAITGQRAERPAVAFEKAAVMYNLGAALSADAAAAKLDTDAGCKHAARRFQEAAGIFEYLHANVPLRLDFQGLTDLAPDATAVMAAVQLAQAQEATYLKAAADEKSPALLARISRHAEALYSSAHKLLQPDSAPLARALGRPMAAHLLAKVQLLAGLSWQHQATAAAADDQCGMAVTCLQEAASQLEAAKRAAGSAKLDPALPQRIREAAAAVATALAATKRENDAVYLQRVPPVDQISRAGPAALVKAAPVPADLEAVDDSFFAFLRTPAPDPPPRKGPGGLLGVISRVLR